MANIIIPERLETESVRRGRDACARILGEIEELQASGKRATRIVVSTEVADHIRAFLDFAAAEFDGVLPRTIKGAPLVVEPGLSFGVAVDFERALNG